MENKHTQVNAVNHPAIQKLRKYLQEYSEQGGNLFDFARSLDITYNALTRYLRGENTPRRSTIQKWAKSFDISFDEFMTPLNEYIPYPFERYSKPKQGGGEYLSKKKVRQEYRNGLLHDYDWLVQEGRAEYNSEIVKILEKPRI